MWRGSTAAGGLKQRQPVASATDNARGEAVAARSVLDMSQARGRHPPSHTPSMGEVLHCTPGTGKTSQHTPGAGDALCRTPGAVKILCHTPGAGKASRGILGVQKVLRHTLGAGEVLQCTPGTGKVLRRTCAWDLGMQ